ncbi:MAG: hypothetical protein C5B43_02530 [Verrucomicrobia bacterium]|nr:MAG: hypothetical protein C5B43_02530 [Verrucomicrobiota bacterium]
MQKISKKILSIIVATATVVLSFTQLKGIEDSEKKANLNSFHNPDEKNQSVLFELMDLSYTIGLFSNLMKTNGACDFCKIRDELPLSLDFAPETPEHCNVCEVLKTFKINKLCYQLHEKLRKFCAEEYLLLKEVDSEIAEEIYHSFEEFIFDSEEELLEKMLNLKRIYSQVRQKGEFPNILAHLEIRRNGGIFILAILKNARENEEGGDGILFKIQLFAILVEAYMDFLDKNSEVLSEIQKIADNDFQIAKEEGIQSLSEIMIEINKVQMIKALNQEKNPEENTTSELHEKNFKDLL